MVVVARERKKERKKEMVGGRRRRTEHRGVDALKIWKRVVEREYLGWADKGKVTGRRKYERDRLRGPETFEMSAHRG